MWNAKGQQLFTNIKIFLGSPQAHAVMQCLLHDSTLYVSFSLAKVMWTWFLKINSLRYKIDTNYQRRESSVEETLTKFINSNSVRPVNLKGNQPWLLTGRTDAKAEALILWPPDAKSRLIGKDPDAGKHRGQEEKEKKEVKEDELVGWYHRFDEHDLGQTPGDSGGQGSMVCCSPWGHKELNMNWWLNNNKD